VGSKVIFATAVASLLAASPVHAEWLEATTPHFVLYGNLSADDLRARALKLEQFDAVLRKLLSVGDSPRVEVYYLQSQQQVADLFHGSPNVAGFYSADAQRAYAVVPRATPEYAREHGFTPLLVLQHEYTHHMMLSNVSVTMPGWAQEGLAETFATAQAEDDGSVSVGLADKARVEMLRELDRFTVLRALDSDDHPPKTDEDMEGRYAASWAIIHYLWFSGQRPGQYAAFIKELNAGSSNMTAAEKAFGDLGKFASDVSAYVASHKFKFSRFSAADLHAPSQVRIRPLTAGEAAMMPFHLRSIVGVTPDEARPLADDADPVGARFADDPAAQLMLTEIDHDAQRLDAADADADRVLAKQPNNLLAMAYKGRVAARRALANGAKGDWATARQWFLKANRVDPNAALPFVLYYDSFVAAGQKPPPDALDGLYRAVVLVPEDSSVRIRAALEMIRANGLKAARSMIASVAFQAEGTGEPAAHKLLVAIDSGSDREALLAKAHELKLDQFNDFVDPPEDKTKGKGGN
jgi:tetratricopeptide (TPR) repeat protein